MALRKLTALLEPCRERSHLRGWPCHSPLDSELSDGPYGALLARNGRHPDGTGFAITSRLEPRYFEPWPRMRSGRGRMGQKCKGPGDLPSPHEVVTGVKVASSSEAAQEKMVRAFAKQPIAVGVCSVNLAREAKGQRSASLSGRGGDTAALWASTGFWICHVFAADLRARFCNRRCVDCFAR
jgi:hypothetical protein